MRRWAIINTLLALMVALLGFEIVRTWARGLPPVEVPAAAPPPVDAPEPHDPGKRAGGDKAAARAQQTPEALVAAIVEKDLFDPSRRAPTVEEVRTEAPPPVTKPPDGVTVVGVRIFGKDREVFVNDTTQGAAATRRLRAGDQVAGYTVKVIEATGVTLTSPSGDVVAMPLAVDKGRTPPAVRGASPPRSAPGGGLGAATSPALGYQGSSPAAGVRPPPPPPAPPPAVATPPQPVPPPAGQQNPQMQQLPSEVRQKLEQLRQNDKRSGRRR